MARVFGETPWEHYTVLAIFEPGVRRRQRARAPELARGDLQPADDRHADPGVDHGARDLPRLEREAAPARRHVALPLRPAPADALALDERGDHRLLRRPGPGPRRWWISARRLRLSDPGEADRRRSRRRRWRSRTRRSRPGSIPTDGTGYLYYPKGALAGLLLDILIRDASDNQRSLDDVMRGLYQRAWRTGRGFSGPECWAAVQPGRGGPIVRGVQRRGTLTAGSPFPWDAAAADGGPAAGRPTRSASRESG